MLCTSNKALGVLTQALVPCSWPCLYPRGQSCSCPGHRRSLFVYHSNIIDHLLGTTNRSCLVSFPYCLTVCTVCHQMPRGSRIPSWIGSKNVFKDWAPRTKSTIMQKWDLLRCSMLIQEPTIQLGPLPGGGAWVAWRRTRQRAQPGNQKTNENPTKPPWLYHWDLLWEVDE